MPRKTIKWKIRRTVKVTIVDFRYSCGRVHKYKPGTRITKICGCGRKLILS